MHWIEHRDGSKVCDLGIWSCCAFKPYPKQESEKEYHKLVQKWNAYAQQEAPHCQWCGDSKTHDDIRCLSEERDALEQYFREAVDALNPYLQCGGKYAHLMSPGESITKLGPRRLVEYFEREIEKAKKL